MRRKNRILIFYQKNKGYQYDNKNNYSEDNKKNTIGK